MIRFVKECERNLPRQHPVGMTYQNRRGQNETLFNSPADWVSPNPGGGFKDDPPDMQGRKVVISDTDHLWGVGGDAAWVWKTVTRGLNPIFMDTYDGKVLGKARPEDEGPRRAMAQAIEYSRRMNLARATPQNALASTGYCLAEPGVSYLVFAPEGGEIEVDVTAGQGAFAVEWRSVASGEVIKAGTIAGGARRSLRAPFDGAAVLFLDNMVTTAPLPRKEPRAGVGTPDLEEGFREPPREARPWVYWVWQRGNATPEGLTAIWRRFGALASVGLWS
jgi:hypothetical protein